MGNAQHLMLAVASGVAMAAHAGPPLEAKAGLWERTVTRQMEGTPVAPVADRSKLTPEQRARVEQMMSVRSTTAPTTAVVRYCLTPDAAAQWDSFAREDGGPAKCERKVDAETARTLNVSLACAGGAQTGTAAFTAIDTERIRGTITWVRREESGERRTLVEIDSRWISSDCGNVKPGAPQPVKG